MRPNSMQLADVAERFLNQIAIREEVVAARKAALRVPADWTDDKKLLRSIAKDCARLLLTARLGISKITGHDTGGNESSYVVIEYAGGIEMTVPDTYFRRQAEEIKARKKAETEYDKLKSECCTQLAALAKMKKVGGINQFRSYVRSRWDAVDAEVILPQDTLRGYFDEFLASQPEFTCKI